MAGILGGGNPAPADPAPADPTPAPTDPNSNPTPAPAEPNPNPTPAPAPAEPAPADPIVPLQQKQAQETFAAMRIQNKQLNETLKGVAALLGIEGNADPTALMDTLQAKILENQAKQQSVPV